MGRNKGAMIHYSILLLGKWDKLCCSMLGHHSKLWSNR